MLSRTQGKSDICGNFHATPLSLAERFMFATTKEEPRGVCFMVSVLSFSILAANFDSLSMMDKQHRPMKGLRLPVAPQAYLRIS